jgi:CrcB protein
MNFLIVFLGAGIGGAFRHGVNILAAKWWTIGFPIGTLTINVLGSLLMGVLAGYFSLRGDASQAWRLFLTTGILGGFTTFSTFSLETALLYQRGALNAAIGYAVSSVILSLIGVFFGLAVMRWGLR